jgi:hypothetical protein
MYVDGSDYESLFQTPSGLIQVLAEVHIFGPHLVLDELLFYPLDQESLAIGVRQTLAILKALRTRAKEQGFTEMTVTYHRTGKRRPAPTVARSRRLL